ncbi:unnamed protein product [Phytophthora fragariaefolia]|uniref:Unnamed protein product n=1 Tax=Phytophthora fragariaefolia TaxID=1490495 RepID=A0A9W6Y6D7_9STRA|nr:unnamed protein product [Phytophthora fragariaefolia]
MKDLSLLRYFRGFARGLCLSEVNQMIPALARFKQNKDSPRTRGHLETIAICSLNSDSNSDSGIIAVSGGTRSGFDDDGNASSGSASGYILSALAEFDAHFVIPTNEARSKLCFQ